VRYSVWLILVLMLHPLRDLAQECTTGCEQVLLHAPFDTKDVMSGSSYQSYFHNLLCTANWHSYSDAQSAGISAIIPIYGMKIPIDANWDNSRQEQWKSEYCSEEDRSLDYRTALTVALKTVHPEVVPAWLECIRIKCSRPSSEISCSVKETASQVVFTARWEGGKFARLSKPPRVISVDVFASDCTNVPRKGDMIDAAGVSVSCVPKSSEDPLFVLQTQRGNCQMGLGDAEGSVDLLEPITLADSRYFKAAHVTLDNNTIVTNGHNLTIEAETLEIRGAPKIVSFDRAASIETAGLPAGFIKIIARRIIGTGLEIHNYGQNGGAGNDGVKGTDGGPGGGGSVRSCFGCGGGSNGGDGGGGSNGSAGHPGSPGGVGGNVVLVLPSDASSDKIVIFQERINPDTNKKETCSGPCGGIGGKGGTGGTKGIGGPGGSGAGPNCTCGGTSGGNKGADGSPGPDGTRGSSGTDGRLIRASLPLATAAQPLQKESLSWLLLLVPLAILGAGLLIWLYRNGKRRK
jgi:uncharacterized membrane protein YgcG